MYKFGLEIIAENSGTKCPVWVAQYGRYIHVDKPLQSVPGVPELIVPLFCLSVVISTV